jgi:hypothetical protein
MATWVVVIPDYMMDDHHVIGPFENASDANEWGRLNVGTGRAWFAHPINGRDDWKASK